MLILTQRGPLELLYASSGYEQIRTALQSLESSQDRVLVIDDSDEVAPWGLHAASGVTGIQSAIRFLATKYPSIVDSVLLVGGSSVIPFFSLANPVEDRQVDGDVSVLTDNPYGAASDTLSEYLAPSLPIGRLPVADEASAAEFAAAVVRLANPPVRAGKAGTALFVNDDWLGYSERVAGTLPTPQQWHISPGYLMSSANEADAGYQTLYFNLHGFSGESDWQAYSTVQRQFVPAVEPEVLDATFVAGALAFAECCYGAQITGRSTDNSCALRLLDAGATFIGATGLAFGSYIASDFLLEDADFLVRAFFQATDSGYQPGAALAAARKAYLSDSSEARQGQPWQCKQKTLLQFVLYGSPTPLS
jgi:Peptidase family C25